MSDIVERLRDLEERFGRCRDQSTISEAAYEIERLRASEARLREALEDHVRAAECIRHWHDTLGDEGMVVSAEHVRLLWEATSRARAALAEKEEK